MSDQQRERKDGLDGARDGAGVEAIATPPTGKPAPGMLAWANSVSGGAVQRKLEHRAKQRRVADASRDEEEEDDLEDLERVHAPGWEWKLPSSMTDAQRTKADAARLANKDHLGERSTRILQGLLGLPQTGSLSSTDLQKIADFQYKHGRKAPDAVVDAGTLDPLFAEGVQQGRHDELIFLVRDFFKLTEHEHLLSLRFDPKLKEATKIVPEGALNVGVVGAPAFKSVETLRAAIGKLRADKGHDAPRGGTFPAPQLTQDEIDRAVAANGQKLRDHRAVRAVQAVLNASFGSGTGTGLAMKAGTMDDGTVGFIAVFQFLKSLPETGVIDDETFKLMFKELGTAGQFNSAIRLAVDFHNLNAAGVLDVVFDAGLGVVSRRSTETPGAPVTLKFGPDLFALSPEEAVHAIAGAYQDARLTLDTKHPVSIEERLFLEEHLAVLSRGMSEAAFSPAGGGGFVKDARRALSRYRHLKPEEKPRLWAKFEEVREKVRERFRGAAPDEQSAPENAELLADYNKETPPPPARK